MRELLGHSDIVTSVRKMLLFSGFGPAASPPSNQSPVDGRADDW